MLNIAPHFSLQFIGYRDSKLTRILKNALGGNSRTVIVATINPTTIDESHSTLRVSFTSLIIKLAKAVM